MSWVCRDSQSLIMLGGWAHIENMISQENLKRLYVDRKVMNKAYMLKNMLAGGGMRNANFDVLRNSSLLCHSHWHTTTSVHVQRVIKHCEIWNACSGKTMIWTTYTGFSIQWFSNMNVHRAQGKNIHWLPPSMQIMGPLRCTDEQNIRIQCSEHASVSSERNEVCPEGNAWGDYNWIYCTFKSDSETSREGNRKKRGQFPSSAHK